MVRGSSGSGRRSDCLRSASLTTAIALRLCSVPPRNRRAWANGMAGGARRAARSRSCRGCAQPHVLLRLWPRCWLTALLATLLAYVWGPPLPYRVGEVCPHDLRARVYFEVVNQAQTERSATRPSTPAAGRSDDPEACEAAARPCRRRRTLPARHAAGAARPADHRTRSSTLLRRRTRAYLAQPAAPPITCAAASPCSWSSACSPSLVVLYVVRFQHEPGPEPAQDRRRLRPGAGDAGAGHRCSASRPGTPSSSR